MRGKLLLIRCVYISTDIDTEIATYKIAISTENAMSVNLPILNPFYIYTHNDIHTEIATYKVAISTENAMSVNRTFLHFKSLNPLYPLSYFLLAPQLKNGMHLPEKACSLSSFISPIYFHFWTIRTLFLLVLFIRGFLS